MEGQDITNNSYKCKLVMLGDLAVGKTSLVLRFVRRTFQEEYKCTIGASFLTSQIETDGKALKFDIWDTAGLERFKSLIPMYYRGAHAAIIVYDITDENSFQKARTWAEEIKTNAESVKVIAIAGNKCDMANKRMVPYKVVSTYATENKMIFMETSAKSGENIDAIFQEIANSCSQHNAWVNPGASYGRTLVAREESKQNKNSCCGKNN